ncbi:MAG: glycosyltransferase family 2 protein [Elusimicrobiota bacterium]|jgi:glycosyltransferase involved in cell wall biosynthesis|nr:glycosyltransferase family 2 protein [Elusimicrobiota bacterium]
MKISVAVPCFNEEKSVEILYQTIKNLFEIELKNYSWEIVFCDDYSVDDTRDIIQGLCAKDHRVKAVFNASNFGVSRNLFSSLLSCSQDTDAVFLVLGDLQDPPELLTEFVKYWRQGYKVILGQKVSSRENLVNYFLRSVFYKIMDKLSDIKQLKHCTGYGLYDKDFLNVLRQVEDPSPYLKGILAEYPLKQKLIPYTQNKSYRGRSNMNLYKNYDFVMQAVTSYTKITMRIASFIGMILIFASILIGFYTLILKIIHWDRYEIGLAAVMVGLFFIGAVQLFFIGIVGEYILSLNSRIVKKPLTVVEKRINFDEMKKEDGL